jgi:uncharacterized protein
MKLEQTFEVAAPLERVWEALIDVERVAPCLPGASVTGRNDDGSYNGEFKVKIGPTSAAYSGKLNMETIDSEVHSATMQASGTDRRGQGGAKATIISSVTEGGPGQTRVEVSTDYHITGRLARFGRGGMIEEISNRLLGDFARNLQSMLASGDEAPVAAQAPPAQAPPAEAPPTAAIAEEALAEGPAAGEAGEPVVGEEPVPAEPVAEPEPAADAPASEPEPAGVPEPGEDERPVEDPDAVFEGATPVASAAEEAGGPTPAPEPPSTPPFGSSAGSAPDSEPISALSLIGSVALRRAKENPAPVVALVLGFLVALRVLRRRS